MDRRRQPRRRARFDPAVTRPAVEQFSQIQQSVGRLNRDLDDLGRSADLLSGKVPGWVAPTVRIGLIVLVVLVVFLVQLA